MCVSLKPSVNKVDWILFQFTFCNVMFTFFSSYKILSYFGGCKYRTSCKQHRKYMANVLERYARLPVPKWSQLFLLL
jgi:hypothetical protein